MNEEDNIIWNEEAQDWGYWKDGVFYEQPQYADIPRYADMKESIAEEAIQEFLTLNPHLEVANDMMCLLKAENRELYDILFERVME